MKYLWLCLCLFCVPELHAQNFGSSQSLRGSGKKLEAANKKADDEKLSKLKSEDEIKKFWQAGLLDRIPNGHYGLVVDPRLEESRRYCRPFAVRMAKDLGRKLKNLKRKAPRPLQVNSCTRDLLTQGELRKTNGNAAPTIGPHASLHLRGNTIDFSRIGHSAAAQNFVRKELRRLQGQCKISAIEERRQAVWHVVVFKEYDVRGSACKKAKPRSKK
ncbi:MAG: DUF5715 family protein [Patescibacteria group bacterium]